MNTLFYRLPQNIATIFTGRNLFFHGVAIASTYLIVESGFDWTYFTGTRSAALRAALFPAVVIGGQLPILVPLLMYVVGHLRERASLMNTAWALAQAEALALFISSAYKAFTGRVPPEHFLSSSTLDISHVFQFGFMRGGVFWGWPSSHTMVAFAAAVTLFILYPRSRKFTWLALLYALYIGVGVSVSIHWFSDFIAGAIIGTLIGIVVGRSFRERSLALSQGKHLSAA